MAHTTNRNSKRRPRQRKRDVPTQVKHTSLALEVMLVEQEPRQVVNLCQRSHRPPAPVTDILAEHNLLLE